MTVAKRALLTGFEPYVAGIDVNPSWEIVRPLDGARVEGFEVAAARLPVAYGAAALALAAAVDRVRPDAVVCFGMHRRGGAVEVERRFRFAEREGEVLDDAEAAPGAARERAARLPVEAVLAALAAAGYEAKASDDAGLFVCEHVGFTVTGLARRLGIEVAGFVHVPAPAALPVERQMEIPRAVLRGVAGAAVLVLVVLLALLAPLARAEEADDDEAAKADAAVERVAEQVRAGELSGAKAQLEKLVAATPGNKEAFSLLARVRFFYADDAGARAALEKGCGDDDDKVLAKLIEGPFTARLGDDAPRFRGKTRGGHYFLETDVGARNPAVKKVAKGKMAPGFDEVGGLLENIYGAYSAAFKGDRDKTLVSRVFVFAEREEYIRWGKEVFDEDQSDAAAYYDPYYRLLVVDADGTDTLSEDGRDSMFHEGFHQFLHYFLPSKATPYWFNEGLAEYFGPSKVRPGKGVEVGLLPRSDDRHVSTLEKAKRTTGEWTPLRELLRFDSKKFMQSEKAMMHYAQSWALVHYLCQSDAGKKTIVKYYDALRAGKSAQEAFDQVFAKTIDRLEPEVKDYVKKLVAPTGGG